MNKNLVSTLFNVLVLKDRLRQRPKHHAPEVKWRSQSISLSLLEYAKEGHQRFQCLTSPNSQPQPCHFTLCFGGRRGGTRSVQPWLAVSSDPSATAHATTRARITVQCFFQFWEGPRFFFFSDCMIFWLFTVWIGYKIATESNSLCKFFFNPSLFFETWYHPELPAGLEGSTILLPWPPKYQGHKAGSHHHGRHVLISGVCGTAEVAQQVNRLATAVLEPKQGIPTLVKRL